MTTSNLRKLLTLSTFGLAALVLDSAHAADQVTGLEVGRGHVCITDACDTVWCWGADEAIHGGITGMKSTFNQTGAWDVAAGAEHACALWRDSANTPGTVECWGSKVYGQLTVPEGTWRKIDAGDDHTCGIRSDFTMKCWGYDKHHQVSGAPVGLTFNDVSSSALNSCGVTRVAGDVRCWGKTAGGIDSVPRSVLARAAQGERFLQVSAGAGHACGVSNLGSLYCWGSDDAEQLSPRFKGTRTATPIQIGDIGGTIHKLPGGRAYHHVSAGVTATCAVYTDNSNGMRGVECFGTPFNTGATTWSGSQAGDRLPLSGGFRPDLVEITYNEVCAVDETQGAIECFDIYYPDKFNDEIDTPNSCSP